LLIVRLSAMGDVIHTLPAAYAPRSTQRPLVDWLHTVNLNQWRKSLLSIASLQQIATVWNDVAGAHYDVAVDLQGAMRSAVLARWSGAGVVWGAAEPRESPASLWYTRKAIAQGTHVIEQNLSVAEAVTQGKVTMPCVALPHDPEAETRVNQRLADYGIDHFALLNPGAGWGAKRWPAKRYGEVARRLAREGIRAILNCGPGEEDVAQQAEAASERTARVMKSSISELIALTRRARLFIGGDTGPMHLASALGVPVVAIFGPTNPARNGPYGTRSIVFRSPSSMTTHARHSRADEGMLEIGTDAVVGAARDLLAGLSP
jgi:heptosyltransferase-1